MPNPLLDRLDLDDVLVKFKLYDRYYAVASVYLTLGMIIGYMWYCNYVFVAEEVGYRCLERDDSSGKSNISNVKNTTAEWCGNPRPCSDWVYDNPDSFVADFELACQDWKRTFVGSAHNFGYMMGLLVVGPLSDRFGRKTIVVITGLVAGVVGPAKSFVTSYWLYVALEFIEGAVGDFFSPLYMLAIEMVATKSRVTYTAICKTGLGVGGLLLALMAWLIPYWRKLLRVLYAPGLLSILLIYLIDESPRWLLAKGKKSAAVEIIQNIAKVNKIRMEENLNMISYEEENKSSFVTVIRDTFKSRSLLKRFSVCIVWWMACTFINFGLIINSTSLEGNKYINFGLAAVMKAASIIVAAFAINKFHRKGPLIFCFLACAVLCTGQPFIPKDLLWLQITNYMIGMLMSSMCFNIIYIFTSELFPTQSRNSMHALCSSVGRIGSIIAPQTPLLMVYWSGLPTVLFGGMSMIAGLVSLLVPDTADQNLPDTVCQAEKMETNVTTENSFSNSHKNEHTC